MKKIFSITLALAAIFFVSAFIATVAGLPMLPVMVAMVGLALIKTTPQGVLVSSLDLSELASDLGAYHREHRDDLFTELLLGDAFTEDLTVMDDVTDEVPLVGLSLGNLTKPADPVNFTPNSNAIKFGAEILKVRGIKVDLLLVPQLLEKTWLGKAKKSSDPLEVPFEAFILQYINQKINQEVRLEALYKGEYNALGTTPKDTFTGFKKLVEDAIADNKLSPVLTGAITKDNIIDKAEAVYDSLSEAYKNSPTIMKVSPQLFDWYNRKYRAEFGANQNYDGMSRGRVPLDGTLCEVVREPGLAGTQSMICTPVSNMIIGVDSASGYSLDVQKFNRSLKILIDFKVGVQFAQIQSSAIAVNDRFNIESGE